MPGSHAASRATSTAESRGSNERGICDCRHPVARNRCVNVHTLRDSRRSLAGQSQRGAIIMGVLSKAAASARGAVDQVADAAAPAAELLEEQGEILGETGARLVDSTCKYIA